MTGRITAISGPAVSVDLKGLRLYERVFVGEAMLTGEVVRIEPRRSVVQVYEDTRGLAVGEPVRGTGGPLTIQLGPGLLSGIFDGLQRPLGKLRDLAGPFLRRTTDIHPLDLHSRRIFLPLKKEGDTVSKGGIIGYTEEGMFRHYVFSNAEGRILRLIEGEFVPGEPVGEIDDGTGLYACSEWAVRSPRPYRRKFPPSEPLVTGQRVIDLLFPLTKGGAAIMPGGFGTGKTVLEQSIAKYADVDIVVYAGCGERGNEMADMIGEFAGLKDPWSGRSLMDRTVLCVNTSNMPVAAREASVYTAVTIAEYYRDMGYHVLFLADSISRWAEALREMSASLEEMPGEEGYPTYLSSRISGFLERAGVVETLNGATGSLSMVLSVSPPGGDITEPVTQSCLRTAGTYLMLDTSLAHRRHFPAINWSQSYTLHEKVLLEHYERAVDPKWPETRSRCRDILRREQSLREVAEIVGVEGLQDADRLMMRTAEKIRLGFLCQNAYTDDAFSSPEATLGMIRRILDEHREAEEGSRGRDPGSL